MIRFTVKGRAILKDATFYLAANSEEEALRKLESGDYSVSFKGATTLRTKADPNTLVGHQRRLHRRDNSLPQRDRKLTSEQVTVLRTDPMGYGVVRKYARLWNVGPATISSIRAGYSYKHVPTPGGKPLLKRKPKQMQQEAPPLSEESTNIVVLAGNRILFHIWATTQIEEGRANVYSRSMLMVAGPGWKAYYMDSISKLKGWVFTEVTILGHPDIELIKFANERAALWRNRAERERAAAHG